VGWDACHEISAESGEGVEEVFRVVTRKLVEQNRKMQAALLAATGTPGHDTPGFPGEGDGYFDGVNARGSFRVGRDRRSWLFSPGFSPVIGGGPVAEEEEDRNGDGRPRPRRSCC